MRTERGSGPRASTTQQIAVALGIAGVGTVFFTVAADHGFGAATVTAGLIEAVLSLAAGALAWRLPSGG